MANCPRGEKELGRHPTVHHGRQAVLAGCLALSVLLAVLPAVAQEAPELYSLPVRPHGHAIERPDRARESRPATPPVSRSTGQSTHYALSNGLDVTVYHSDALASRLTWRGGETVIPLDDGRYLSVITDIDHPSICNKGDGQFHPFDQEGVVDVLEGISHPNMDLKVTVYLLPYPRQNLLVSSTSGSTIFLSPHVREIHPAVCAYIVAHEMGHVFHNAYLPEGSALWNEYLWIRSLTDTHVFYTHAAHAYRPREIFAEDYRVLFGGDVAAFDGRIENPELPSPNAVPGLRDFMAAIGGRAIDTRSQVNVSSYPNPFNPETEIHVVIPRAMVQARERVTVTIYDIRGALVRELYSGAPLGDDLYVSWDGRDNNGNAVASAHYFASIEVGQSRATLKLVLLK
jgi:hypothetical protein